MIPLYTTEELSQARNLDLLKLQCEFCDDIFRSPKKEILRALKNHPKIKCSFCSHKCARANTSAKKTFVVECLYCQAKFSKQLCQLKKGNKHFCSSSCFGFYHNSHKKYGIKRSKLESWLETKLSNLYPHLNILFNDKTVISSELDIYIPSLKMAFELNGIVHYKPIYGEQKLANIINNDKNKIKACLKKQISLYVIDTSSQKKFTEETSSKFLTIIKNCINNN